MINAVRALYPFQLDRSSEFDRSIDPVQMQHVFINLAFKRAKTAAQL